LIPLFEIVHSLFKFNKLRDVFIFDFVAMIKAFQGDIYVLYFDFANCFAFPQYFTFNFFVVVKNLGLFK
jgi:hypothetical protein